MKYRKHARSDGGSGRRNEEESKKEFYPLSFYRWLTDKYIYASIVLARCSCCCLFTGDNCWVRSITQPHVHKINPNAIFPSILLLSFKVVVVVYSLNFDFLCGIYTFSVHRSLILYFLKFVFYTFCSPSTKQTIACKIHIKRSMDKSSWINPDNRTRQKQPTKMMLSWR